MKGPLNSRGAAALVGIGPVRVRIDPLLDVERAELLDGQVASLELLRGLCRIGHAEPAERLGAYQIPDVGQLGPVLLAPVEEAVNDTGDGMADGLWQGRLAIPLL